MRMCCHGNHVSRKILSFGCDIWRISYSLSQWKQNCNILKIDRILALLAIDKRSPHRFGCDSNSNCRIFYVVVVAQLSELKNMFTIINARTTSVLHIHMPLHPTFGLLIGLMLIISLQIKAHFLLGSSW